MTAFMERHSGLRRNKLTDGLRIFRHGKAVSPVNIYKNRPAILFHKLIFLIINKIAQRRIRD